MQEWTVSVKKVTFWSQHRTEQEKVEEQYTRWIKYVAKQLMIFLLKYNTLAEVEN